MWLADDHGHRGSLGSPEANHLASLALHRPVRLVRADSTDAPSTRSVQRLAPPVPDTAPSWDLLPQAESTTPLLQQGPSAPFHDAAAVHIITTGALHRLAAELGRDHVDETRFRPNLVLDMDSAPEPGDIVEIENVELTVQFPAPRCIVPGLQPDGQTIDLPALSTLARNYRRDVAGLGTATCFGVYATVTRPGTIHASSQGQYRLDGNTATSVGACEQDSPTEAAP